MHWMMLKASNMYSLVQSARYTIELKPKFGGIFAKNDDKFVPKNGICHKHKYELI